jgi:hypothetical protein
MKIFIILCVGIICVISGYLLLNAKTSSLSSKIHYHAGFMVYIDGVLQDFSGDKYMNTDFCSAQHKTETPEEIRIGKAHLHDNVGNVMHVHRAGAVWGDLFNNINYAFPEGKPIAGYVNGKSVPDIFTYPIQPYDSIIITVGDSSAVDLTKTITKSHILDVEKHSEGCSV